MRRSPYGERGLKYGYMETDTFPSESLSLRRAWIEIAKTFTNREGIEVSLSLRRAWIEIFDGCTKAAGEPVALLTESVD